MDQFTCKNLVLFKVFFFKVIRRVSIEQTDLNLINLQLKLDTRRS